MQKDLFYYCLFSFRYEERVRNLISYRPCIFIAMRMISPPPLLTTLAVRRNDNALSEIS